MGNIQRSFLVFREEQKHKNEEKSKKEKSCQKGVDSKASICYINIRR